MLGKDAAIPPKSVCLSVDNWSWPLRLLGQAARNKYWAKFTFRSCLLSCDVKENKHGETRRKKSCLFSKNGIIVWVFRGCPWKRSRRTEGWVRKLIDRRLIYKKIFSLFIRLYYVRLLFAGLFNMSRWAREKCKCDPFDIHVSSWINTVLIAVLLDAQ